MTASDAGDRLAVFANYGATKVHLAAPGVNIWSTYRDSNASYAAMSGTSMSTPLVAGAAALLFSAQLDASYLAVKAALLSSVDKQPSYAGRVASGGRLNVARALAALLGTPAPQPPAVSCE